MNKPVGTDGYWEFSVSLLTPSCFVFYYKLETSGSQLF